MSIAQDPSVFSEIDLNDNDNNDTTKHRRKSFRRPPPLISSIKQLTSPTSFGNPSPNDVFEACFDLIDINPKRMTLSHSSTHYGDSESSGGGGTDSPRLSSSSSPYISTNSSIHNETDESSNDKQQQQSRLSRSYNLSRQDSIIDSLLYAIYDREHHESSSFSDITCTEMSTAPSITTNRLSDSANENRTNTTSWTKPVLMKKSVTDLRYIVTQIQLHISQANSLLVRNLRHRDKNLNKLQRNYDIITAILQAASLKRREDTQMKFSLAPSQGDKGFQQWKDAICVASRMPNGVPPPVRQKLWISLASNYIREIRLDWNKIRKFAFNNCANSDDDELGIQIVKDLHRTGCSWSDNEHDRSTLKRVLLAFARYNKSIGYCQGLNILTAVILEVVDKNEEDALMVLIYLVDKILPDGFFTNNLRALAIDMAVFREWLRIYNVKLHNHLHQLQISSKDASGTIYEPPLLNVFTIQWFLTLFATCLPRPATLRVWDALLLEGSEVLFRTGLVIWSKLAISVLKVQSADQFYSAMGLLSVQLLDEKIIDVDNLIRDIYAFGPFPTSILSELRQKFSFNITPFQQLSSSNNVADRTSMKSQQKDGQILMDINGLSTRHGDYKSSTVTKRSLNNTQNHGTDEETAADEEIVNFMSCFSILASSSRNRLEHNSPEQSWANSANSNSVVLSRVTPGAYSNVPETHKTNSIEDSLSLDINQLHRQYKKLRERQKQAQIIMQTASAEQRNRSRASSLHPNDSRRVGPPPTPTLKSTRKTDDLSSGTISDATLSSTNVSNNKNTSPLTKQHSTVCSIKGGPLINHLLLKAADPKRNMYKKNVSIKAPVSTIQNTRSNSIVDSTKYTYPDTPSTETSKHEKKQVLSEDDTVEEDVDIQIEIEQLLTSLNLERPVIQKSVPKITTKQPIDDENSSTTDNETENRLENIARTLYDYQKTQNLSETDSDSKNSNIFASKQRNGSIMGRLLTTNPNGPRYSSFNPFPSRSFNENVAMNGYKLGLYAPR